jgi:HEAT repeat protein
VPEVGYYKPDVLFVPVLIFLAVTVVAFVVYTLVGRYLYERRRARLEEERLRAEGVFRYLDRTPGGEGRRRAQEVLLGNVLDGVSSPNKVALVRLINGMEEPKRSGYLERVMRYEGWRSLTGRALRSPFKWRRIEAIGILGELDIGGAIDVLSRCLEDGDEDVVYTAARALARKEDLRAAEILLGLFGADRIDPKRLVTMLEDFPTPIHDLLWPRLKAADPGTRVRAATLLGVSEEPGTAPRLVEAARDPDADVRSAALRSLADIGDPRAEEALPEAFDDEAWFVRASAARLTGVLKAAQFYDGLVRLLQDRNWWVRQNAKTALIALCPEIEERLERYLVVEDRFVRNMVAEVLDASGYVQRRSEELERDPDSEEARRFFERLISAEGRGSIEGLARRASPELRTVLRELLDADESPEQIAEAS